MVRHAEKDADPADDPPLSAAGKARALELADILQNAGVQAIFTTPLRRTRDTAAPLAERLGVSIQELTLENGVEAYVAAQARRLLEGHRGEVVLVVSHSNTVPLIIRALGGEDVGELGDHDYDDLFTVAVPDEGPPRTAARQYGAPDGSVPRGPDGGGGQASGAPPAAVQRLAPPTTSPPAGAEPDRAKRSVADVLRRVIEARGVETAVQAYMDIRRHATASYDLSEPELEGLGREFLEEGRTDVAGVLFEINAYVYPESARAHRFLGDALRAFGRPAEAAQAYSRALDLDPTDAEARKGLELVEG